MTSQDGNPGKRQKTEVTDWPKYWRVGKKRLNNSIRQGQSQSEARYIELSKELHQAIYRYAWARTLKDLRGEDENTTSHRAGEKYKDVVRIMTSAFGTASTDSGHLVVHREEYVSGTRSIRDIIQDITGDPEAYSLIDGFPLPAYAPLLEMDGEDMFGASQMPAATQATQSSPHGRGAGGYREGAAAGNGAAAAARQAQATPSDTHARGPSSAARASAAAATTTAAAPAAAAATATVVVDDDEIVVEKPEMPAPAGEAYRKKLDQAHAFVQLARTLDPNIWKDIKREAGQRRRVIDPLLQSANAYDKDLEELESQRTSLLVATDKYAVLQSQLEAWDQTAAAERAAACEEHEAAMRALKERKKTTKRQLQEMMGESSDEDE